MIVVLGTAGGHPLPAPTPVKAGIGPRRLVQVFLVFGMVWPALAPAIPSAAVQCRMPDLTRQTGHISLWLSGLPDEATTSHPFYVAAEDAGMGRFEILAGAHVCYQTAAVRFATTPESASPSDFQEARGRASFIVVHTASPWIVKVPIEPDGEVESPIETFRVTLSNPRNGSLRAPFEAPFHIVDDDGADRATLDPEPYQVSESDGVVEIAVFRAGTASATMSVPYLVEASGSQPATPNEDFTVSSANPLSFGPGERIKVIQIAVNDDGDPETDETLRVSLPDAPPGAVTESTVTIDGEIDASPPRSRFHHPRQRWTYASDDYRIREIHVFTHDRGDSGVVQLNLALRRVEMDGTCGWWDGDRFRAGECTEPGWISMRAYEPGWFYYYRIDPLAPSVGTQIKNYTAFAQGVDAAANIEVELLEGRNRNTFEVSRR